MFITLFNLYFTLPYNLYKILTWLLPLTDYIYSESKYYYFYALYCFPCLWTTYTHRTNTQILSYLYKYTHIHIEYIYAYMIICSLIWMLKERERDCLFLCKILKRQWNDSICQVLTLVPVIVLHHYTIDFLFKKLTYNTSNWILKYHKFLPADTWGSQDYMLCPFCAPSRLCVLTMSTPLFSFFPHI